MEEYIGHLDLDWNVVLDQDQPIVRCRDCKWYDEGMCYQPDGDGGFLCLEREPDGFCKWGEKK